MKKIFILLTIMIFTFSCGTKRIIYNNPKEEPKKDFNFNFNLKIMYVYGIWNMYLLKLPTLV